MVRTTGVMINKESVYFCVSSIMCMKVLRCILSICGVLFAVVGQAQKEDVFLLKTEDIQIRDPFIIANNEDSLYYMYAASKKQYEINGRAGVMVYKSQDLSCWTEPELVFEVPENTWADPQHGIWAPEVHYYKGNYYLFCTLTSKKKLETPKGRPENILRGTQIFVSESLLGPFVPTAHSGPTTPGDWMALDGTLYEEKGKPYLVFCHEWTQVDDGTFEMMPLDDDLVEAIGLPQTMFRASDAPWTRSGVNYRGTLFSGRVTDGPWFYKTRDGVLLTLWSSFDKTGYCLSYAVSLSGLLEGPWTHPQEPLLDAGHGHGCLFYRFDGQLMLVCHSPNNTPLARATFYALEDTGVGLEIKGVN